MEFQLIQIIPKIVDDPFYGQIHSNCHQLGMKHFSVNFTLQKLAAGNNGEVAENLWDVC